MHPLGATLEIEDYEGLEINDEILICLAGPIFNIAMAIVSIFLFNQYDKDIFMKIFEINIVLGVFNLIPAHPLDGAKIWRAILSKFFIYKKAHKIVMMTSFCMSVFIIIIGSLLMFENITSINLVFIGILMIFTSYSIKERTMYIVLDQIISKNKRFKEIRYIENKDISVYWKEDFIKLLSMIERNKFNTFYILNDKMEYLYDLREDEVVEILKTNGNMSLEDYYNNVLK